MSNNSYYNDAWRIINEKNQSLVSNYSMDFDGLSDFIDCGNNARVSITGDLTLSAWVYLDNTPSPFMSIFSKMSSTTRNYTLYVRNNRTVSITTQVSSGTVEFTTSTTAIPLNTWTHIVATFNSGVTNGTKYYFNGIQDAVTGTHNVVADISNLNIGRRTTGTQYWNGKIDQVSIFDYALPATGTNSIATLYGGGTAVTNPMALSPAPVAYYQLGDQTASNNTTEPTPAVQSYLVPNNSLQDYVFDFDGSDYINFINGSTMARGQEISYSVWANLDSFSGDIIGNKNSSNRGTGLNFSTGNLIFQLGDGSNDSWTNSRITLGNYVNTGEWFNVVGTFDGINAKIYINGIERNSWTPTQPFTISGWNNNFQIGKRADSGSSFIYGKLSNIAFWNSGLTPTQVETIYNNGSPNDISSLSPVSWYKLNAQDTFDGTNWTIKDYAGSNDGTSNGMTSANLITSNLQHTSGFSPYALSFDGTNQEFDIPSVSTLELYNTDFSISFWCKVDASISNPMFFEKYTGGGGWALQVNNDSLRFYNGSSWTYISGAFQTVYAGLWTNVTIVGDLASTNLKCYINGSQVHSSTNSLIQIQNTNILTMAGSNGNNFPYAGGLSNVAIWSGTALSAAEVTEVYNQGVPINLNTFSGNKPNHWWQLGSNSSFNSNSWTCLDEGISASTSPLTSAVSTTNMAEDDITNGVGYSANGLGTSSIEIVGDAPYSTANGISNSMDVLSRSTDLPPTV